MTTFCSYNQTKRGYRESKRLEQSLEAGNAANSKLSAEPYTSIEAQLEMINQKGMLMSCVFFSFLLDGALVSNSMLMHEGDPFTTCGVDFQMFDWDLKEEEEEEVVDFSLILEVLCYQDCIQRKRSTDSFFVENVSLYSEKTLSPPPPPLFFPDFAESIHPCKWHFFAFPIE